MAQSDLPAANDGCRRKRIFFFSFRILSVSRIMIWFPKVILLTEQLPGYSRIILAISSLYYMPLHPRTCCLLYSISCILDAFDGYAARRLDQSTRFGAVLDMITDRCTTSSLLVFLASAFPRFAIIFQGLISLDFASHFMHVYATLAMGGSSQSHKKIDESRSWVLKQYYSNNVRKRFAYFQKLNAD